MKFSWVIFRFHDILKSLYLICVCNSSITSKYVSNIIFDLTLIKNINLYSYLDSMVKQPHIRRTPPTISTLWFYLKICVTYPLIQMKFKHIHTLVITDIVPGSCNWSQTRKQKSCGSRFHVLNWRRELRWRQELSGGEESHALSTRRRF